MRMMLEETPDSSVGSAGSLKFDTVIIRYGGEIGIKGEWTRRAYETRLRRNIKEALRRNLIEYDELKRRPGRLYLKAQVNENLLKVLSKVFGISSLSPAVETGSSLREIVESCLKVASARLRRGCSFAVRCRRVGDHPYTSEDVCRDVGSRILEAFPEMDLRVDLESPDVTFWVEVRDKEAFIYVDTLRAPGGMPLGTQPKLVCLLSGGLDSPVACWLAMRRGSPIVPLYFDNSPFTPEADRVRAVEAAKAVFEWAPGFPRRLYIAQNGSNLKEFLEKSPRRLICLLCKRLMYRIAEKVADLVGAAGIVTGEIIGEQASQTLWNLKVLDAAVTKYPVYRPVLCFDKVEVERLARKIGTYEISAKAAGGCEAAPSRPRTKASLEEVLEAEKEVDVTRMVERSLSSLESVTF